MSVKTKPRPKPRPRTPDEFLRDAGFVIHARPAHGEAVWTRGRIKYTQQQATAIANREWASVLRALEEMSS